MLKTKKIWFAILIFAIVWPCFLAWNYSTKDMFESSAIGRSETFLRTIAAMWFAQFTLMMLWVFPLWLIKRKRPSLQVPLGATALVLFFVTLSVLSHFKEQEVKTLLLSPKDITSIQFWPLYKGLLVLWGMICVAFILGRILFAVDSAIRCTKKMTDKKKKEDE